MRHPSVLDRRVVIHNPHVVSKPSTKSPSKQTSGAIFQSQHFTPSLTQPWKRSFPSKFTNLNLISSHFIRGHRTFPSCRISNIHIRSYFIYGQLVKEYKQIGQKQHRKRSLIEKLETWNKQLRFLVTWNARYIYSYNLLFLKFCMLWYKTWPA